MKINFFHRYCYRWITYFVMIFVNFTIILDATDEKTYSNLIILGDDICVISGVIHRIHFSLFRFIFRFYFSSDFIGSDQNILLQCTIWWNQSFRRSSYRIFSRFLTFNWRSDSNDVWILLHGRSVHLLLESHQCNTVVSGPQLTGKVQYREITFIFIDFS